MSILIVFLCMCCNSWICIFLLLQISVVLHISYFCFNPALLYQTFEVTLWPFLRNSEFFGLEFRAEWPRLFKEISQSLLKTAWTQELLNIWEIHTLHTLQEKSPDEIKVILRTEMCSFSGNVWFITMFVYLLCPHVSNCKNQRRRCFPKTIEKICHLLTINLSGLPWFAFVEITTNAFLPSSKWRDHC